MANKLLGLKSSNMFNKQISSTKVLDSFIHRVWDIECSYLGDISKPNSLQQVEQSKIHYYNQIFTIYYL